MEFTQFLGELLGCPRPGSPLGVCPRTLPVLRSSMELLRPGFSKLFSWELGCIGRRQEPLGFKMWNELLGVLPWTLLLSWAVVSVLVVVCVADISGGGESLYIMLGSVPSHISP